MPARKRGQRPLPHALGLKEIEPLPAAGGAGKLAAFAVYRPGSLAPWWLHQGVCAAWGLDVFRTELRLVTVSENATFSVLVDEKPYAMARVSQPDYAGGALAVASELSWVRALGSIADVNVVEPLPMASGFDVATIRDEGGFEWLCVCTRFVPGATLEAPADPSRWYETIGACAARMHGQSRQWRPPQGFTRFAWDIDAIAGDIRAGAAGATRRFPPPSRFCSNAPNGRRARWWRARAARPRTGGSSTLTCGLPTSSSARTGS